MTQSGKIKKFTLCLCVSLVWALPRQSGKINTDHPSEKQAGSRIKRNISQPVGRRARAAPAVLWGEGGSFPERSLRASVQ